MKITSYLLEWLIIIGILLINCSRISSLLLATSDSFPTSEQTNSPINHQFEKINYNSTEQHYVNELSSDKNDKKLSNDVTKRNDRTESLVDSEIQDSQVETVVIERNVISNQENVEENFDRNGALAQAILLDSISTNSGINGIPDIPATAPIITLVEKVSELNLETKIEDENDEIIHNNTQSPLIDVPDETIKTIDPIGSTEHIVKSSKPLSSEKDKIVLDVPPDEQVDMINDSGGSERVATVHLIDETKLEQNEVFMIDTDINEKPSVNLTVEENQIPVFSEWAQKHLEEAEKKLEKESVNTSTMKKNSTQGHKTPVVKLRAKNYASPDCGAKIIAANSEASSTGSVLTTTKDEYLLSPCTSRIWFVVELCEAIQAEIIDLANFELFSSSPKNFSVSVSNRFPNRDWSNVGRFTAKDERDIQSFDLSPHLFGKYVRVDIHSHYNSEHFCPISLFRVYGTSEFEAFETENRIHSIDDDDEDGEDEDTMIGEAKSDDNNIFQSASDVVMSLVKKAASLVKPNDKESANRSADAAKRGLNNTCMTPNFVFMCKHCSENLTAEVNNLLNCELNVLNSLLSADVIRQSIYKSQICANLVGLDLSLSCNNDRFSDVSIRYLTDLPNDYVTHMLPVRYVAAMCNVLGIVNRKVKNASYVSEASAKDATNLTIDKMGGDKLLMPNMILSNEDHKLKENKKKIDEPVNSVDSSEEQFQDGEVLTDETANVTRKDSDELDPTQIQAPPVTESDVEHIVTNEPAESNDRKEPSEVNDHNDLHQLPKDEVHSAKADTINGNWDNIEVLLSTPVPEMTEVNSLEENVNGALTSPQPGQKVHSESVFLRLSNRIKALERNMSLSGQYLEELSRRYKKQVEELQLAFARSLTIAEEQTKRYSEREQQFYEQTQKLRDDLDALSENLFSWKRILLIFVVFAAFQISIILFVVKIWIRKHIQIIGSPTPNGTVRGNAEQTVVRVRRKSTDAIKDASKISKRERRPSEEALHISGTYQDLLIQDDIVDISPDHEEYDSFVETRKKGKPKNRRLMNVKRAMSMEPIGKSNSYLKRQDSAPGDFEKLKLMYANAGHGINETPLLDENYDVYVPGNEWNEYMPDGPSGDQNITNGNDTSSSTSSSKKTKSRRLSSPAFLKSPFSRQNSKKSETATGWEWYRLKRGSNTSQHDKSKSKSESPEVRLNGFNGNLSSSSPSNNLQSSSDSLKTMSVQTNASDKKSGSFRKILKKVF